MNQSETENLDQKSLISIFWYLMQWGELENVEITIKQRPSVASSLWIQITFRVENQDYIVDGSTPIIVKARFLTIMRELNRLRL